MEVKEQKPESEVKDKDTEEIKEEKPESETKNKETEEVKEEKPISEEKDKQSEQINEEKPSEIKDKIKRKNNMANIYSNDYWTPFNS